MNLTPPGYPGAHERDDLPPNFGTDSKHLELEKMRGFTLIELILAIGLFSVSIPMIIGIFVSASRAQRETTAFMMANSSISLALEQMTREMRTSKSFTCSGSCEGTQSVSFVNAKGEDVTYALDPGTPAKAGAIKRSRGGTEEDITSPSANIRDLAFYVYGEAPYPGDIYPARVTISLNANPRIKNTDLSAYQLRFQTTVSARFDYF